MEMSVQVLPSDLNYGHPPVFFSLLKKKEKEKKRRRFCSSSTLVHPEILVASHLWSESPMSLVIIDLNEGFVRFPWDLQKTTQSKRD